MTAVRIAAGAVCGAEIISLLESLIGHLKNIAKQVTSCHAAAVLNLKDMASVLGFVDGVNAKVLVEDEVVKIDLDVKLPDSLLSLIL